MNLKKIKKGCGIIFIAISVLLIGFIWMIKEAFGPTFKTVEIEKPLGKLVCTEQYTADMAGVLYDVDFKLINKNLDTLYLGNGIYNSDDWSKSIELIKIKDWYGIMTNYTSYAKIGITNKQDKEHLNLVFSPLELKEDTIWKKTNTENPAWVYQGSSKINSFKGNELIVEYEYRLGLQEPFKFKNQKVHYVFDLNKRKIITKKVEAAKDI